MRILIDTKVLGRGETSGIPGYAKRLIGGLIERGSNHEFTLLSTGLRKKPLPAEWLARANVSVAASRFPNKLLDAFARFFNAPAWGAKTKSDLIFSPHFNILPTETIPRVLTIHDISFVQHPEFFTFRERFWHWLQNYKKQIAKATHIITVSHYTKADLVTRLAVPEQKISVIYPGVDAIFRPLGRQDVGLTTFIKKYSLNQPFILFLGALGPRKNILGSIRAFSIAKQNSHLKDYQLILAGAAGRYGKKILVEVRRSPFASDIRFLGHVPEDELVYLYNAARCFIFPSFFEGFGFPPLEAQACGVPVIASNRTSLPEILESSAAFIDPWRIQTFAQALISIETSEKMRAELIQQGLRNAQRFSWDTTIRSTLSLIESNRESIKDTNIQMCTNDTNGYE